MKKASILLSSTMGIIIVMFLLINGTSSASKFSTDTKASWFAAGSHPKEYQMEISSSVSHSGKHSAMMKYIGGETPSGFGTYMQMHKPGAWTTKKVKMTAFVKTENVDGWCGMWFRVDGSGTQSLDFDNMQDRPLKGTNDWTKCEITLNVPKEATAVAYGVLLAGKGTVYFDDAKFEIVGDAVAGESHTPRMKNTPENLDFEN